jgi:hypothetical protein
MCRIEDIPKRRKGPCISPRQSISLISFVKFVVVLIATFLLFEIEQQ